MDAIEAIDAIPITNARHARTVTASRTCNTGSSLKSGCNSAAKCAALATLDSMDVKL